MEADLTFHCRGHANRKRDRSTRFNRIPHWSIISQCLSVLLCAVWFVEINLGFLYYKINRFKEAHEHLDKARRVHSSLRDKIALAEVDETRACVFLQEARYAEAERVAFSSVRALEQGQRQAKLAEALITHGRALARLGSYAAFLSAFRRAIAFAEETANLNRAADAALAAFQEVGDHLLTSEGDRFAAGQSFSEAKHLLEHDFIKRALDVCIPVCL
jgi:tetratricopeptide (TPR) repeat protein